MADSLETDAPCGDLAGEPESETAPERRGGGPGPALVGERKLESRTCFKRFMLILWLLE